MFDFITRWKENKKSVYQMKLEKDLLWATVRISSLEHELLQVKRINQLPKRVVRGGQVIKLKVVK